MRIWGFLIRSLALLLLCSSFKMADRLLEGKPGDYIVTQQDRNYSLLFLRELRKDAFLFEEITVPVHLINKSSPPWKEWLSQGAPGHTSWVQYEIDPSTFQLIEAYSFSKNGWMYLDETDYMLSKLLSLPLSHIPHADRKKIGPAPREDEADRRKLWNPPFAFEGKKTPSTSEAWKTFWPQDSSLLSSCQITLYFPPKELSTFPSWIEASNGHFSYAIKLIDSGKNIESPLKRTLPHRPPQILKPVLTEKNQILISIKASQYYKSFSLFASDITKPRSRIGPIPFSLKNGKNPEEHVLSIAIEDLSAVFEKNHHYKWLLLPESAEAFVIESDDFFRWSP
ncbi:MAG: hypothetical protein K2Y01_03510 [Rhabdochlamydiaceae bacterium]|nr:hypothetical protein [Rhabdochlamydiaceae bacterium]